MGAGAQLDQQQERDKWKERTDKRGGIGHSAYM